MILKNLFLIIFLGNLLLSKDIIKGKELFNKHCVICHGENGKGLNMGFQVNPRDLTKSILNKSQVKNMIKYGNGYYGSLIDNMPPFQNRLTEKEIDNIAIYITEEFNKEARELKIKLLFKSTLITDLEKRQIEKWGKKIFKRNCIFCHGIDGKGDGVATKNPEKSIYPYNLTKTILDEEQIFLYTKFGGKHWGTARGDMPSWNKKYSDFKLKAVSKYINKQIKDQK